MTGNTDHAFVGKHACVYMNKRASCCIIYVAFLYPSLCVALYLTSKLPFHLPSVVCWPSCSLRFVLIVSCAIVTAGTSALYSSQNKAFLWKRKSSLGCIWNIAFVKFPVLQCQTKQNKAKIKKKSICDYFALGNRDENTCLNKAVTFNKNFSCKTFK